MAMFKDVLETVRMIEKENLDIRTITMGISLMDCIDADGEKARRKIYDKITRMAEHLVSQGERIETEFGIPIVNKRVSVTPISLIAGASSDTDYVAYAETLDKAAHEIGVNFIGGFSALVPKGFTPVSYTHLDVDKRQRLARVEFSATTFFMILRISAEVSEEMICLGPFSWLLTYSCWLLPFPMMVGFI